MIKSTINNFSAVLRYCMVVFIFTISFHLFSTPSQIINKDVDSQYSISSIFESPAIVQTCINSSNTNDVWVIEEEIEENEDNSKRKSVFILSFAHLYSSLFKKDIQNDYSVSLTKQCLSFSTPLYIKHCIYLI
jgi:hypothetical protein